MYIKGGCSDITCWCAIVLPFFVCEGGELSCTELSNIQKKSKKNPRTDFLCVCVCVCKLQQKINVQMLILTICRQMKPSCSCGLLDIVWAFSVMTDSTRTQTSNLRVTSQAAKPLVFITWPHRSSTPTKTDEHSHRAEKSTQHS